jgi:hypothetical protein
LKGITVAAMAITHESLNQFSKGVVDTLLLVLSDDLGKYSVGGTEVPAVWVSPPDTPQSYKVVPNSGIEAVFSQEPDMTASNLMGRLGQELLFCLLLRQWDLTKSIIPATHKVMACKKFVIHNAPVIRPYQELGGEIFYAQAKIFITATKIDLYS